MSRETARTCLVLLLLATLAVRLALLVGGIRGSDAYAYARRSAGGDGEAFRQFAREWTEVYCRGLRRVDSALLPAYPALLRPYLERPAYRLVYRDGAIIGREGPETDPMSYKAPR
jgi:hypothetical protein